MANNFKYGTYDPTTGRLKITTHELQTSTYSVGVKLVNTPNPQKILAHEFQYEESFQVTPYGELPVGTTFDIFVVYNGTQYKIGEFVPSSRTSAHTVVGVNLSFSSVPIAATSLNTNYGDLPIVYKGRVAATYQPQLSGSVLFNNNNSGIIRLTSFLMSSITNPTDVPTEYTVTFARDVGLVMGSTELTSKYEFFAQCVKSDNTLFTDFETSSVLMYIPGETNKMRLTLLFNSQPPAGSQVHLCIKRNPFDGTIYKIGEANWHYVPEATLTLTDSSDATQTIDDGYISSSIPMTVNKSPGNAGNNFSHDNRTYYYRYTQTPLNPIDKRTEVNYTFDSNYGTIVSQTPTAPSPLPSPLFGHELKQGSGSFVSAAPAGSYNLITDTNLSTKDVFLYNNHVYVEGLTRTSSLYNYNNSTYNLVDSETITYTDFVIGDPYFTDIGAGNDVYAPLMENLTAAGPADLRVPWTGSIRIRIPAGTASADYRMEIYDGDAADMMTVGHIETGSDYVKFDDGGSGSSYYDFSVVSQTEMEFIGVLQGGFYAPGSIQDYKYHTFKVKLFNQADSSNILSVQTFLIRTSKT